jgi:hypothetical protein
MQPHNHNSAMVGLHTSSSALRRLGKTQSKSSADAAQPPPLLLTFTKEEEETLSAGVRLKRVAPTSLGLSMRIRLLDVALRIEATYLSERARRIAQWKTKDRHKFLESEQTCGQFALAPPLTPDESDTRDALRLAFEHVFAGMKPEMCLLMGQLMRHKQSPKVYNAPDNEFWSACNHLATYAEDTLRVTPSGGGAPRTYCFTPLRHARQVEGMRLMGLRHPWWSFVRWYKKRPRAELKQPELYDSMQRITHPGRFALRFVYDTRPEGIPKVPHVVIFPPGGGYEQFWIYGKPGTFLPAAATLVAELDRLKDRVETLELDAPF